MPVIDLLEAGGCRRLFGGQIDDCEMLLLRRAVNPNDCERLMGDAKNAIQGVLEWGSSKRKLRLGAAGYYTFQALGKSNCHCKYDYEGTASHP
eukprot:6782147-Lingulodinium_polyedra.AAC.1